jgi:hypothetical protein
LMIESEADWPFQSMPVKLGGKDSAIL